MVSHLSTEPEWVPRIQGVFSNPHGELRITLKCVSFDQTVSVQETIPLFLVRLTLPTGTCNIAHKPWLALQHYAELREWYGPYTYIWPPPPNWSTATTNTVVQPHGAPLAHNGLLLPAVHDLTITVEDLIYHGTDATLVTPRWENAPWYVDAKSASAVHHVLAPSPDDKNAQTTANRLSL